eukprot:1140523-Pelagomonas_calceolata.AAC.3
MHHTSNNTNHRRRNGALLIAPVSNVCHLHPHLRCKMGSQASPRQAVDACARAMLPAAGSACPVTRKKGEQL